MQMARFKFFLIGSTQAPVLDVDAADIGELGEDLCHTRFLLARTAEVDGVPYACRVLVPVSRIQMIAEPDQG